MPTAKTARTRQDAESRGRRDAADRRARLRELETALHRLETPAGDEIREPATQEGWMATTRGDDWLLDAGARIAAWHPDLDGRASDLRALLAWEAAKGRLALELAGGPRRVVTAADLHQVRIASEAIAAVWREDVLEPGQAALALGAKQTNREKVSALRRHSSLLGLPRDRGYLYPAFQIDTDRREVYPDVRAVNETLGAEADPWGVASWWFTINDRLAARPADLVGTSRAGELIEAAKAVTAPIG